MIGLAALLLATQLATTAPAARTDYRIDTSQSQADFKVRLLWLDHVNGNFRQIVGDVEPGPQPHSWVVDATIAVNSVSMPSDHLREWLLGKPFFDAEHYPQIHFISDPIAQEQLDQGGELHGELTLRGVTAPITFDSQPMDCHALAAGPCRIVLRGSVQRSAFGMTSDRLAVSDRVDLNLSITLQREIR